MYRCFFPLLVRDSVNVYIFYYNFSVIFTANPPTPFVNFADLREMMSPSGEIATDYKVPALILWGYMTCTQSWSLCVNHSKPKIKAEIRAVSPCW